VRILLREENRWIVRDMDMKELISIKPDLSTMDLVA